MIDYRKSALVHMLSNKSGNVEFILHFYGLWPSELKRLPGTLSKLIESTYPDHTTMITLIEDGPRHKKPSHIEIIERKNLEALF